MTISYLRREGKPDLAYVYSEGDADKPLVVFCGGYRSDMGGTKAIYLEEQCRMRGQAYLRFDYSGHGDSEGEFEDGTIGDWAADALAVLDHVNPKSVILVGSSMGGWMALLIAKARPDMVKALVGIAAAPDFTEDMFARLDDEQRAEMMAKGFVKVPNDYSDEPYHYSRQFYEEAKAHLVLGSKNEVSYPIRLVHGKQDVDVPWALAEKTKASYQGDVEIIYVEDGDHRLSRPQDLELIDSVVQSL